MTTEFEIDPQAAVTDATNDRPEFGLTRVALGEYRVSDPFVGAMAGAWIDRRAFLKLTAKTGAAVAVGLGVLSGIDSSHAQTATTGFLHGVASGDPLPDRVIIWTRLTPTAAATPGSGAGVPASVTWQVSRTSSFASLSASGTVTTSAATDHTVKVDVAGLAPSTSYFYRFAFDGTTSPVGQMRTAPAAGEMTTSLRFGVVSCSNFEGGFFAPTGISRGAMISISCSILAITSTNTRPAVTGPVPRSVGCTIR